MKIYAKQLHSAKGWLAHQVLELGGPIIKNIRSANENEQKDKSAFDKCYDRLAPGLIDIQVNGGGDALFNAQPSVECLEQIFRAHQRFGTSAMLPTLITDDVSKMQSAADAVASAIAQNRAGVVGIHFEGPWLASARKGVHKAHYIREPSEQELEILFRKDLGVIMVTLAAETVSTETISRLCEAGVIVFLGHSNADATSVQKAIDAGASGFTHLYNAMSPMQSREPGMVGVALTQAQCYTGLIVDGHHVDPICCKLAYLAKGRERLILVTDAMALAASAQTQSRFFDTVINKQGGKLTTPDGTLAGSCLTMIDAVRNASEACECSISEALYMASETPAKALGISDKYGLIKVGAFANFMSLDAQHMIQDIWHHGQIIHS